jgi:hypothetical protein
MSDCMVCGGGSGLCNEHAWKLRDQIVECLEYKSRSRFAISEPSIQRRKSPG